MNPDLTIWVKEKQPLQELTFISDAEDSLISAKILKQNNKEKKENELKELFLYYSILCPN